MKNKHNERLSRALGWCKKRGIETQLNLFGRQYQKTKGDSNNLKLLKRFKGESDWIKTTFEKEQSIIKNSFVDLKLAKEALKRGEVIITKYSLYKIDKAKDLEKS